MHIESTARSVTDFALAAKPYLEKIGRKPESDEVILFGYSQGAAITMGVLDILQKEYADVFPVKKVYAGGGPYDIAATVEIAINDDKTGIPCAVPMIVQGMNVGERLGLEMKHFFKPRLLDNYQEWINSKKYTIDQIRALMGSKTVHEFITDECRDKSNPNTAKFYEALERNSTLHVRPKAPTLIYHSRTDTMIPFEVAEEAEAAYKADNVKFDFGYYGTHSSAGINFLFVVLREL
jgi:pimeloyl-ACP methyl ester carboxylesterase